jgi:hypothetical protein
MADERDRAQRLDRDGAGSYSIQVLGRVEQYWEPELRMQVSHRDSTWGLVSTLRGYLPDQAALLGNLGRLTMWGYLILSVCNESAVEPTRSEPPAGGQ